MNGLNLEAIEEERDLGIIVDKSLKVNKQCVKAVKSANAILGMIKRTFMCRKDAIILQLYEALVRPKLDYCVQACRPYLQKDIDLIEKVQKELRNSLLVKKTDH